MELVVAVFLGFWLGAGCWLAYRKMKKDFTPYLKEEKEKKK